MKTINQLLYCARRELELRQRVYPRQIQQGNMTAEKAKHEIECMADIVELLDRQRLLGEISQEMQDQPPLPFTRPS